jgi:hypothetical protein
VSLLCRSWRDSDQTESRSHCACEKCESCLTMSMSTSVTSARNRQSVPSQPREHVGTLRSHVTTDITEGIAGDSPAREGLRQCQKFGLYAQLPYRDCASLLPGVRPRSRASLGKRRLSRYVSHRSRRRVFYDIEHHRRDFVGRSMRYRSRPVSLNNGFFRWNQHVSGNALALAVTGSRYRRYTLVVCFRAVCWCEPNDLRCDC